MNLELGGLISSATAFMNLAKGAIDARDDAKAKEAISGANAKLYELSMALLTSVEKSAALQTSNIDLNAKIAELEAKLKENASYKLTPLGKNGHAYVLVGDDGMQATDKPVYFCQHCRDKGIKCILRYSQSVQWEGAHWSCVENNSHVIYE